MKSKVIATKLKGAILLEQSKERLLKTQVRDPLRPINTETLFSAYREMQRINIRIQLLESLIIEMNVQ